MALDSLTRAIKSILITAIAVAFVIFAIDNRQTVRVSFSPLPYLADMPEFLLLLICFAMGAITGGLLVQFKSAKIRRLLSEERKRANSLQSELSAARSETQTVDASHRISGAS